MTPRIATLLLCLAGFSFAALPAMAAKDVKRDLSKDFDDLTPSEQIAIRAAAKAAYKQKKLKELKVCADPGNMPLSNIKSEGFQNKMAEVLGEAMGAQVSFNWRPFIERGLTRQTFDQDMCDVLFDMPANYGPMLTTFPIYKTPYVLVYRNDKGLELTGLDDPKLKDLKIGVFQTSALRAALAKRGIVDNITLQVPTHDGDLVPEHQPWHVVQDVTDGKLDVAGVFGPFAGWRVSQKHEPLTILPVNLQDDTVPLEFDLAIGVRKTDAFLKYMLEFALDDKKDEIEKILRDYGVPLVQCSKCLVQGDLPAHGSYIAVNQQDFKPRPDLASPDQVVTEKRVAQWLDEGADITQELSNAINANDRDRIKWLVTEKGADVNKQDSQGYTPLTNAARQRQDQTAKLLIDLKADPNLADGNDMTPLVTAVMRDSVPTIKVLLDAGAKVEELGPQGFRPLALAIGESKYESAKALMDAGADVNVPSGSEALTPLMIASAQSAPAEGARFLPGSTRPIDIAKSLIDRNADVNAKSSNGMTALMIAAAHNNPPMIGLLMESGADPDAKNNQGQTASEVAQINGNLEAAQAIKVLATAKAAAAAPAGEPKSTSQ
ncbi:MAG TPA: quinoprotein dehydrogenase-associated putative ABC transporter substrate-binding protein [Sphingomicrobium sp.]|jgi:quinoprotein dehydrogenase-associated probable ABC transporter substrate-binding protein|nr:quinoprotein dehydrogenase-associated putative ABC transporter substrate-binding protein [Sphingomicrobium sp.]HLO21844.1 quinoprotein dehydrogenase-associated putative ABC transporter substrate-binding protein [Methyloceanibacter sp.]